MTWTRYSTRAWPALGFVAAAGGSVLGYLGASAAGGFIGFPLDDSWIHQTYARNLAYRGEFAFVPGQPSAGSTSPLWTVILAIGYWLRVDYRVWTLGLGVALLALNAWLVYRLVLRLWPGARAAAIAAGVLVTLEWHLVWAAASGMETLLFSAGALLVLLLDWPRYAGLVGLIAGLTVLARPDGLSLLPFLAARAWLSGRMSPGAVARASLGFGVLFVPYLIFNYRLSGSIWPNTFYAKQAEYAVLRQAPLWTRLASVGALPFVGVLVLLTPGIVVAAWRAARRRQGEILISLGWVLAFVAVYALRLPVTYQYGRYLMPVIPVLAAIGMGGLAELLRPQSPQFGLRVISRTWLLSVGLIAVAFWVQGAVRYTRDVQFIETEMVATARWVNANTPPAALIATHDIGALGYFSGRRLLDMAGLASPAVIPFIRDEARLGAWLDASGADYLVTFPSWYPALVASLPAEPVYVTDSPYSQAPGAENMAVYRWRPKFGTISHKVVMRAPFVR
jgi:hypothetical protein